jgi:hypothetical protein
MLSRAATRVPGESGQSRALSILAEDEFHRILQRERKRSQRSGKAFMLVMLDVGHTGGRKGKNTLPHTVLALAQGTRDTDVIGWYDQGAVIGIMFTEIGANPPKPVLATMLLRVSGALRGRLSLEEFGRLSISFQLFPEEGGLTEVPGEERFRFLSRFAV